MGITVGAALTSTTLTDSPSGSIGYGTSVVLTATVTDVSATASPTGTVTFLDGSAILGHGTVNAAGVATTSAVLPVGNPDPLSAVFAGSTNSVAARRPR